MGEAKRRRDAGETPDRWKPVAEAPATIHGPVAVECKILCSCAGRPGGMTVISAFRQDGHWISDCKHDIEPTTYLVLPTPPSFRRH